MSYERGEPVEFELNSTNASGTAVVLILRTSGSRASRTLAADERLVILQVSAHIIQAASRENDITAVIHADTDGDGDLDAGDLMVVIGGGHVHASFGPGGMAGALGVIPKVLASASGQIYVAGSGYIMKG